jgi:hypothetical protein
MAFAVEEDELANPLKVTLVGAVALGAQPDKITDLFEQFRHSETPDSRNRKTRSNSAGGWREKD